MDNKIDFIITWVDGNDPAWLVERDRYADNKSEKESSSSFRYRDWDTLRYWFRGVEKFAPWVNKIFFVTWGHLPKWLDTDNPKIQIVKHSEYIPIEFLPTFNSNVIEFYFNRIKGLSEKFVYFNDDFFLLDYVNPSRFFKNGLPCDIGGMTINIHNGKFGTSILLSKTLINEHFDKQDVVRQHLYKWFNLTYFQQSLLNLLCLIIRKKEFVGFVNPHLPQAFLKETFDNVWEYCKNDLDRTSTHRFRDYGDVAFWLFRYWQLASNNFSPTNPQKDGIYYVVSDNNVSDIVSCIGHQKKKMICLNDSGDITNFEETKNAIVDAFERILPEKCTYECS